MNSIEVTSYCQSQKLVIEFVEFYKDLLEVGNTKQRTRFISLSYCGIKSQMSSIVPYFSSGSIETYCLNVLKFLLFVI